MSLERVSFQGRFLSICFMLTPHSSRRRERWKSSNWTILLCGKKWRSSLMKDWRKTSDSPTSTIPKLMKFAFLLSSFPFVSLPQILAMANVKPSVLQVESHPYLTQEKLIKYCIAKVSLLFEFLRLILLPSGNSIYCLCSSWISGLCWSFWAFSLDWSGCPWNCPSSPSYSRECTPLPHTFLCSLSFTDSDPLPHWQRSLSDPKVLKFREDRGEFPGPWVCTFIWRCGEIEFIESGPSVFFSMLCYFQNWSLCRYYTMKASRKSPYYPFNEKF